MKFYTIIAFIFIAIALNVSSAYDVQIDNNKALTKRNTFEFFIINLQKIIDSLKESKQKGQQRMKSINHGCVWKICSRPLKISKPTSDANRYNAEDIARMKQNLSKISYSIFGSNF